MPTLTKRGSGTPVTSGTTWTTTTNAVDGTPPANPATYAVWTNATSGGTGYIEVSGYDFSTIPASAIINSVSVRLRHFENNTTRINNVTFQAYSGATPLGTVATATRATVARDDIATFPVTLAQLQAANFKVRTTATRGAFTQSHTFNVDLIDVTVDYSVEEKSGGATEVINVLTDGGGQPGRKGGSDANVNTVETGIGSKAVADGSTELIGVASEGAGSAGAAPELSGGSEANVNVLDSGAGRKIASGGASSFPVVDAEAAGFKKGTGGVTEIVQVGADGGTGTTTRRGGSDANVNVDSTGTGVEKSKGGTTARVGTGADAAGRKAVSRGATTFPKVGADGTGRKQNQSGSTEIIGVDAEGSGQAFVIPVGVFGGSTTHPKIGADGTGRKATFGSGEADVGIGADGSGRKTVARGSEANVGVDTEGAGYAGAEPPEGVVLNDALALYLGAQVVSSAYLGDSKVWPAFSPLSLSGLAVWYDASQLGLADDALVGSWTDMSGNGKHMLATGAERPTFKTGILNGLPVVRFNGTSTVMRAPFVTYRHIFAVAKYRLATFADYAGLVSGEGGNEYWMIGHAGTPNFYQFPGSGAVYHRNGALDPTRLGPMQQWCYISMVIYQLHTGITFMVSLDRVYPPRHWDGDMAEVFAYDRALTDSERIEVEDYLKAKWGMV